MLRSTLCTYTEALDSTIQGSPPHSPSTGPEVSGYVVLQEKMLIRPLTLFLLRVNAICSCPQSSFPSEVSDASCVSLGSYTTFVSFLICHDLLGPAEAMKQGIMGASYFCILGFPQAWLTKTGRVVVSPRVGMQLLGNVKHMAFPFSCSRKEMKEG